MTPADCSALRALSSPIVTTGLLLQSDVLIIIMVERATCVSVFHLLSTPEEGNRMKWKLWIIVTAAVAIVFICCGAVLADTVAVTLGTRFWEGGNTYVASGDVTIQYRVEVKWGTVTLILADGATLNAKEGIYVPPGVTLIINGQSQGTGKLV